MTVVYGMVSGKAHAVHGAVIQNHALHYSLSNAPDIKSLTDTIFIFHGHRFLYYSLIVSFSINTHHSCAKDRVGFDDQLPGISQSLPVDVLGHLEIYHLDEVAANAARRLHIPSIKRWYRAEYLRSGPCPPRTKLK